MAVTRNSGKIKKVTVLESASIKLSEGQGYKGDVIKYEIETIPEDYDIDKNIFLIPEDDDIKVNQEKKVYGSNKYIRLKIKIQKVFIRINNVKKDYLHKITTNLIQNYQYITIEDLQVSNMIKNRNLSKSISQSNWRQFRTMLEEKAESYGNTIIIADKWFPSTQLCSNCGQVLTKENKMKLSDRWYKCDCGHEMDRDYNAAVNLKLYGKRFVGQAN